MSIICWNCRGLRNQRTKDQLADMVWAKDPSVVFLAETWTDEARLTQIQDHLKFKNKFVAPRRHKAGGLVIYWKEEFDLTIETFSKNHIDAIIKKIRRRNGDSLGFMASQILNLDMKLGRDYGV